MNFDEVYSKVQSGNATEEEKRYFDDEIKKLGKLKALLDDYNEEFELERPLDSESKFVDADMETIKKARRKFNSGMFWRILTISIGSLILIAAIVCGIIFIPSISSAKKNEKITLDEAVELATECLAEHVDNVNEFYVHDVDKELEIKGSLNNAYYIYEIEFRNGQKDEYQIDVNARSGYVKLSDVDLRKR